MTRSDDSIPTIIGTGPSAEKNNDRTSPNIYKNENQPLSDIYPKEKQFANKNEIDLSIQNKTNTKGDQGLFHAKDEETIDLTRLPKSVIPKRYELKLNIGMEHFIWAIWKMMRCLGNFTGKSLHIQDIQGENLMIIFYDKLPRLFLLRKHT